MRLAEFIKTHREDIASEWERFAGSLLPDKQLNTSVLRDSITVILDQIVSHMGAAQDSQQKIQKSKGEMPSKGMEDVADTHATERMEVGLSARQLTAEFRALRASVIRLWRKGRDSADRQDLEDLTRFNEAVDEALIETQGRYADKIEKSRELFLAILGHDLRTPLHAISGAADLLMREPDIGRSMRLPEVISTSAATMSHLIRDLTELTRVKLGQGLPLERASTNIHELCAKTIHEAGAAHPEVNFVLEAADDLRAFCDERKLGQALSNLVGNAVQHGARDGGITVAAQAAGKDVEISVHNWGPPVPEALIPKLFDLFAQGEEGTVSKSGSMGLGLFIAKEIAIAHGGSVNVRSTEEEGTTFCIRLPRNAAGQRSTVRYPTC